VIAVNHLDLDSRLLPQRFRHTGGMLARATSDRAFTNRYVLHSRRSLGPGRPRFVTRITLAIRTPFLKQRDRVWNARAVNWLQNVSFLSRKGMR
jgi:hypothetical protein